MQGLIRDLLTYSRLGTTNGKTLHRVSSENALEEALANLRIAIAESGAIVTHDTLPRSRPTIPNWPRYFKNLIGNAIKYHSAEVPRIHVSVKPNNGNEWIFSVRDNGLGIDPQYFEKIFVLSSACMRARVRGHRDRLGDLQKILERLGGRIWVESQPEHGSTFFFALRKKIATLMVALSRKSVGRLSVQGYFTLTRRSSLRPLHDS